MSVDPDDQEVQDNSDGGDIENKDDEEVEDESAGNV